MPTAFFQWGWGGDPLGLGKAGPIQAFLPVVTLSILFGLSMENQVFLVSRMNEEWVNRRDSQRAITTGQTESARVITAAATIMIFVFLVVSVGGQLVIAEFGVGLAAAVALNAFVLRTVLVPAGLWRSTPRLPRTSPPARSTRCFSRRCARWRSPPRPPGPDVQPTKKERKKGKEPPCSHHDGPPAAGGGAR